MGPTDFLQLLRHSQCLIGNSSVGIRECAFLGVPVVNIGSRQNRRERAANVIDVPYDKASIIEGIQNRLEVKNGSESSAIYGNGNSGNYIAEILAKVPLRFHKTIMY